MCLPVIAYGSVTNAVLRLLWEYDLNSKEERDGYQGLFCLQPDSSLSLIGTGKQIFSNDEVYKRNLFVATLGYNGMFRASFTYTLSYPNSQITKMHLFHTPFTQIGLTPLGYILHARDSSFFRSRFKA